MNLLPPELLHSSLGSLEEILRSTMDTFQDNIFKLVCTELSLRKYRQAHCSRGEHVCGFLRAARGHHHLEHLVAVHEILDHVLRARPPDMWSRLTRAARENFASAAHKDAHLRATVDLPGPRPTTSFTVPDGHYR